MDRHGQVWINAKQQQQPGPIRSVTVTVTDQIIGIATIVSYPDGAHVEDRSTSQLYEVPTYNVTVGGADENGSEVEFNFEAIRFGIQENAALGIAPRIVGMKRVQTHYLSWARITTLDDMAWRVTRGWFIHEGPADPQISRYGSIGCIEICGEGEWERFNSAIQYLSGSTDMTAISKARAIQAVYQAATPPPIVKR